MTLVEALRDPSRHGVIIAAGAALVEDEVARKRGLTGTAVRTGFATVKRLRPDFVPRALEALMPDFAAAIDPLHDRARESGDVMGWWLGHSGEIADALLGVTDARAERTDHRVLLRVYRSLRGRARVHVVEAVPGLARLVTEHVP